MITLHDRIYDHLINKLMVGDMVVIDKAVKPENKDAFISIVKEFIRYDMGEGCDTLVEFTNDYTAVVKIKRLQNQLLTEK